MTHYFCGEKTLDQLQLKELLKKLIRVCKSKQMFGCRSCMWSENCNSINDGINAKDSIIALEIDWDD